MFETVALYFYYTQRLRSGHPIKRGFTSCVVNLFACILTCEMFKVAAAGFLKTLSNDIILCNPCTTTILFAIRKEGKCFIYILFTVIWRYTYGKGPLR